MKKVMLYAYSGINLGDDLFIKILCERYPNTKFVLFAPRKYKELTSSLGNLHIVPSDSYIIRGFNFLLKLLKRKNTVRNYVAKTCDVGVQIGGSIFMQREGWRENTERKKRMLVKNQPFFVLGANFGPYYDEEFYLLNKSVIEKYTDICFRDQYSFNLFKDLKNVRIADDIVFQLDSNVNNDLIKSQNKNIVISVIKPSFREELKESDSIYYEKIKDIATYFINNGYNVTLISFCEHEGDDEAINSITKLTPKKYRKKIKKHFYKLDIEETLSIIATSDFVVATRFHSMILGWLYGKPVFPIAYSEKMTNVMKDVGYTDFYSTFDDLYNLQAKDVYTCKDNEILDISKQVNAAENHFKELDKVLLNTQSERV
ncbi:MULTISPECIES: polysaccharide pyruvyl transferase family protein [unclassified Oceanobacillus]|uniref:polysaccharide pyruvyl transferase family protein n=1 Tax=unclassified Oceanobacillus TaxID=2630292 RepID=UPI00300E2602